MVVFEDTTIKGAFERIFEGIKIFDNDSGFCDIDFNNLLNINEEFFEDFVCRSSSYFHCAKEMLRKVCGVPLIPRFNNLPKSFDTNIKDIRPDMIGKFFTVYGVVKNITDVNPRVIKSAWKCVRCESVIHIDESERWSMRMPIECYKNEGGCGKTIKETRFEFLPEKSEYQSFQKIIIQESPEKLKSREKPKKLVLHLTDDLCDGIRLGERASFSGTLKIFYDTSEKQKTVRQVYVDVNNISRPPATYDEIVLTDKQTEEVKKMGMDPDIKAKLIRSLAPTIYGLGVEKQTILLQLVGGVPKSFEESGGRTIRGDIHILFVGEPGISKSSLAHEIKTLLPNSIYVSGKGASSAGLTCSAIKNKEGQWDLEAGAMVLADGGMVIIDELDKLDDNERRSLHQGMSIQQIEVAKAGLNATFNTRCSVLGIANPKFGRFDDNIPIVEQIDFDAALLDRFDVIFTKADKVDETMDTEIAKHIVQLHQFNGKGITSSDIIPRDIMRDYISYARRLTPQFDNDVANAIEKYYVHMRQKNKIDNDNHIPITPRHIESIIRLSEASAKLRLSKIITMDDFEMAKSIVIFSMRMTSFDSATGTFDVDISTGIGRKSQAENYGAIYQAIRLVGEEGEKAIISKSIEFGCMWSNTKIENAIKMLHLNGKIVQYKNGFKMIE